MKLTLFDKDVENIKKLADRPNVENGCTAEELKALFDKAGCDIKEYINNVLVQELMSAENNMSGADRVGSGEIESVEGASVQDKLKSLSQRINELASGAIPDGSVTPDKFAPDVEAFLTSASVRNELYTTPGEHGFTAERAGKYKVTLVGGGAGGGVVLTNTTKALGGGGGGSLIVWIDLEIGDVVSITVGEGGNGLKTDEERVLISHASSGGDSVLSVNGSERARAGGAPFSINERAVCTGGDISYGGSPPKAGGIYQSSSPDCEYRRGGDTILGYGAMNINDTPGIGGGGYAAKSMGGGSFIAGTDGSSGGALIEYLK